MQLTPCLPRRRALPLFAVIICALATFGIADATLANQLANPGFEANAVLNAGPVPGATGWNTFANAATTSAPNDPTHSGIGSLRLVGGGNFSVPGAFQTFPASPGELWNFEGYMLTPAALPANATFGLLKIVWSNGTNDLPPGQINVGQAGPAANPGIESLPFLNAASTPNTWNFTQAQGVAPAGTTQVSMFALFVDQSPGTGYFDDLDASLIPEPSCAALALAGVVCFAGKRRR
jgi:hypothetical protein